MDTNAILCLALTVISNFSRSVPIAGDSFPKGPGDVRVFTIGRRYFPLDLYLRDKRGDQFWIYRGAVAIYLTPQSYFTLQDPKLIPNFVRSATLNSNEVRRMALTSMQHLSPTQFLGGVEPVFKIAKPYRRKEIPFYEVRWPDPVNPRTFSLAHVEVDASRAVVVALSALDLRFCDQTVLTKLSNYVYQASSP